MSLLRCGAAVAHQEHCDILLSRSRRFIRRPMLSVGSLMCRSSFITRVKTAMSSQLAKEFQ
jgi:hypothetical protein